MFNTQVFSQIYSLRLTLFVKRNVVYNMIVTHSVNDKIQNIKSTIDGTSESEVVEIVNFDMSCLYPHYMNKYIIMVEKFKLLIVKVRNTKKATVYDGPEDLSKLIHPNKNRWFLKLYETLSTFHCVVYTMNMQHWYGKVS